MGCLGSECMVVHGCGIPMCNGMFELNGAHDGVPKWSKTTLLYEYSASGIWVETEKEIKVVLFRARLQNGTHSWYISQILPGKKPGTQHDIDYYVSDSHKRSSLPPRDGWGSCLDGGHSPPNIVLPSADVDSLAHLEETGSCENDSSSSEDSYPGAPHSVHFGAGHTPPN